MLAVKIKEWLLKMLKGKDTKKNSVRLDQASTSRTYVLLFLVIYCYAYMNLSGPSRVFVWDKQNVFVKCLKSNNY